MNAPKNTIKSALQQTANANPSNESPQPVNNASRQPEKRPPARQGKKLISGHFDKEVHYRLKRIALETDTTIQDLLSEALNLLFEQYEHVARFLSETYQLHAESQVLEDAVYETYQNWCEKEDIKPLSKNKMREEITAWLGSQRKRLGTRNGNRHYSWVGMTER